MDCNYDSGLKMLRLAFIVALLAAPAMAADDQARQIEALQAALQWSTQQTNTCNAQQLQMAAEIAALRKRISELDAPKQTPGKTP